MLWDVTYDRYPRVGEPTRGVLQVEADTLSRARTEGLRIIGSRSNVIRIDRFRPPHDPFKGDPANRKVQGT